MALLFRLRALRWVFALGVALGLAGCSRSYFVPLNPWMQDPELEELAYEDVMLSQPDGLRSHGWWIPAVLEPGQEAKGTVYFLHGNAQNISTHLMAVTWLP